MIKLRLLIVEDNVQDLNLCRDSVVRYMEEKQCKIEIVECKSVKEAGEMLDKSFDGAIIDMRLDDHGDEGNEVIRLIAESFNRIPVAILTGTPDAADSDFTYIGVYKKGDPGAAYADLFDRFWGIFNTGLTRIMGGRGIIEEILNIVFQKNLLPQIDQWVAYGDRDVLKTEKALLRHALSHLLQLLDDDGDSYFPEEVYLAPPLTCKIQTGSIVKDKEGRQRFVVMNPSCDLVIRDDGKCNNDRILIVEIDSQASVFPNHQSPELTKRKINELKVAFENKKSFYYHWLPMTDFFEGGFLNFRKISTMSRNEFKTRFAKPEVQISHSFVKDMVARLSSYYARQGQPSIDFDKYI